MRVKLVAWTKEGYSKVIADVSEKQVHMHDLALRAIGMDGLFVDPEDFPEMERFSLQVTDDEGFRVV
jgi:hypothetical protein